MGVVATAPAGLFIMTRFPQPGQTKTRLIPALGADGAARLQRQMTQFLLYRFQGICRRYPLTLEVHFAGGTTAQMIDWLGHQVPLMLQSQGSLGQRLSYAFNQGFARGLPAILIVGSDCLAIEEKHIAEALAHLASCDVVIGPAEDGGYYLIGLNAPQPSLFAGISWGQSCVLRQTVAIAAHHRLSVALLPCLADIDRPEDLHQLSRYCQLKNS